MKFLILLSFISLPTFADEFNYWVEFQPNTVQRFFVRHENGTKYPATFECLNEYNKTNFKISFPTPKKGNLATKACSTLAHVIAYAENLGNLKESVFFRLTLSSTTDATVSDFTAIDPDRSKVTDESLKQLAEAIKVTGKEAKSNHVAK